MNEEKIAALTITLCTVLSTTVFAQSNSGVFNFESHQANGYLNVFNKYTGEANTVRQSGPKDTRMFVSIHAKSRDGYIIKKQTVRNQNSAYTGRIFGKGDEIRPLHVWQSQHSTSGTNDPYYHLVLYV